MLPLFGTAEVLSMNIADAMKLLCSVGSLVVTLYFWFVRSNRERVAVAVYHVGGFESSLEPYGVGLWSGKIFLANRSILPTAIVRTQAELFWQGRWITGMVHLAEGCELPWNLPPSQVFAKNVTAAFDVGKETTCDQVYANQRLRFTFETVEGCRVTGETESCPTVGASPLQAPVASVAPNHLRAAA